MSLESALEANTKAINELIGIWKGANAGVQAGAGTARTSAAKEPAPTPQVDRAAVKALLLTVIRNKGEAVAAEALGKHNAVKLSQVADDMLPVLHHELKALA